MGKLIRKYVDNKSIKNYLLSKGYNLITGYRILIKSLNYSSEEINLSEYLKYLSRFRFAYNSDDELNNIITLLYYITDNVKKDNIDTYTFSTYINSVFLIEKNTNKKIMLFDYIDTKLFNNLLMNLINNEIYKIKL